MVERIYEDVVAWTQETKLPDGRRVIDQEWVQINLARVRAGLEYLILINWKVAALEAAGDGSTRPTPARPRCSAPSSSSRRTACWPRSSARRAASAG